LQQKTVRALARGTFPEKTPAATDDWSWLHCQLRRPGLRHPLELIVPDMAGEALAAELEHAYVCPVLQPYLQRSAGAMVLIDAWQLRQGRLDHDFFGMKVLSYLAELDRHPRRGWSTRPLAVVFTKADLCEECRDDPEGFARQHAPGLWQQCGERFERVEFFAASVAGACAYRPNRDPAAAQVPLRIEPHGIVEPFLWLVDRLSTQPE